MIRVEALTKVFPNPDGSEKTAVDCVTFEVRAGEIYGLLGPNGAGKTTTLRMISGLLRPTAGRIWIGGEEVTEHPDRAKRQIGYLTANTGLYARLTPVEVLEYFASVSIMCLRNSSGTVHFAFPFPSIFSFALIDVSFVCLDTVDSL